MVAEMLGCFDIVLAGKSFQMVKLLAPEDLNQGWVVALGGLVVCTYLWVLYRFVYDFQNLTCLKK